MGKLIGPRDIATGENIREVRLQVVVNLDTALGAQGDAKLLKPVALNVWAPSDCQKHFIEGHANGFLSALGFHKVFTVDGFKAQQLMVSKQLYALLGEPCRDRCRDFGILARHDARRFVDLCDF